MRWGALDTVLSSSDDASPGDVLESSLSLTFLVLSGINGSTKPVSDIVRGRVSASSTHSMKVRL